MPRRKGIPSYRFHKARNCAVVTIDGKNFYLGAYDSAESYEKYARLIAEWKTKRFCSGATPATGQDGAAVSVNELILAFWQHAKQRYVKDGQPTSEIRSFRVALRPVRQLYGREPVTNFGPLALVACRQKLIDAGYCRRRINQHIGRVRQMFKWGVARELAPETTWRALCAVEGLRPGEAPETDPVTPVPEEHIAATEPFLSPQVWAMVNLQLWSGCRPKLAEQPGVLVGGPVGGLDPGISNNRSCHSGATTYCRRIARGPRLLGIGLCACCRLVKERWRGQPTT